MNLKAKRVDPGFPRVDRDHQLHPVKNENYLLGVSMTLGDKILGTLPDPAGVERSDSMRALGVSVTD